MLIKRMSDALDKAMCVRCEHCHDTACKECPVHQKKEELWWEEPVEARINVASGEDVYA